MTSGVKLTYKYVKEYIESFRYTLLSTEYVNARTKLKVKCPHGHVYEVTFGNFKRGKRCKKCLNINKTGIDTQVTPETCIATTDSWMIPYFVNKEDAYIHSHGSNDIVEVRCIDCGKEKKIMINNLHKTKSIGCSCGDGVSYPNKFVYSTMVQIFGIDNVFTEQRFEWSDNKIYDILIKTQNGDILIENHGMQHYEQTNRKGKRVRTLQEEQENDKCKNKLALKNGFTYIELDCRKSDLEYIKNSILNSELSKIVDLSKIDWIKCEEYALSNKVKQVCDYWREHNEVNNEGLTTTDIRKVFNLNATTIVNYLKKGIKLGWCNYDPKKVKSEVSSKNGKLTSKSVEIFKDGKSLGIFLSCSELERQSERLFGVKLSHSKISAVCNGKRKTHKGYIFRYITKEEFEKQRK